ncbi:hypothetical protein Hte_010025 [Hypoxylon texense]
MASSDGRRRDSRRYVDSPSTNLASISPDDTLYRDVVVIGESLSGTYIAVKLRDYNKTVTVVKKKGFLGEYAETYVGPNTGYTVDLGVIVVFAHLKIVTDYFARAHPNTSTFPRENPSIYTPPSPEAFAAAPSVYAAHLEKYLALQGSFNLAYLVDPDLLLRFGELVARYDLDAVVP